MQPAEISAQMQKMSENLIIYANQVEQFSAHEQMVAATPFFALFTAFVLACFIGYHVVWSVTPALHSPLMGVTNAISSVIIVGAILALGATSSYWSAGFGFIAVVLASVNIFGGFVVTRRMLGMFKKKPNPSAKPNHAKH